MVKMWWHTTHTTKREQKCYYSFHTIHTLYKYVYAHIKRQPLLLKYIYRKTPYNKDIHTLRDNSFSNTLTVSLRMRAPNTVNVK